MVATVDHAERLVGLGITGVLVAGTTGEAAALDGEERRRLVAAVRDRLPRTVPVIAGTGAASGRQAGAFTAAAADAGADAALVLPPPNVADPRPYFDVVAGAAPALPLLAYHYPAVSSPGIPLDALGDLPVVGMKDSTGDVERLLGELATWDRPVYPGSSALLSTAAALGCPGAILALANADPEGCLAAFAPDGAAAQQALYAGHVDQRRGGFPHGIKRMTAARFGTSTAARLG